MKLQIKPLFLALLSSLLLIISFPHTGSFTPLVFVALVPLLQLRKHLLSQAKYALALFLWTYLTFLFWNIGSTWWVANASLSGAVLAFSVNALLMTLVFLLWSRLERKSNIPYKFWLLIPLWLLFEFGHQRWDLSWPWLTLGNYFSIRTGWIQWYEWTGTLGGSAWVLFINISMFKVLEQYKEVRKRNLQLILTIGTLVFPIICSQLLLVFAIPTLSPKTLNAVVVQPNVDPYNEKFTAEASNEKFTDSILALANRHVTPNTDLVLAPETALPLSFLEDNLERFAFGQTLIQQVQKWQGVNLLIGASTAQLFDHKNSVASMPLPYEQRWFENYNSSLLLTKNQVASNAGPQTPKVNITYVHKSKLVPGVELIPFASYLPFLSAIAIENGGTSGTLGTETEPKIVNIKQMVKSESGNAQLSKQQTIPIAPIICYESIYGDFVRKQVQQGAQLLCILTNDGWWGDTPGYKQHFGFARLRAIETRRWVLRSANTGTSGSIDPSGKIIKKTPYWVNIAFTQEVQLRTDQTFYVKHGDWLAGLSISWILLSLSALLMELAKKTRKLQS
jgi:apolipoprotein N-acyltransferase